MKYKEISFRNKWIFTPFAFIKNYGFKNYLAFYWDFSWRIWRKTFITNLIILGIWWFLLWIIIWLILLMFWVDQNIIDAVWLLVSLIFIPFYASLYIRRLHDLWLPWYFMLTPLIIIPLSFSDTIVVIVLITLIIFLLWLVFIWWQKKTNTYWESLFKKSKDIDEITSKVSLPISHKQKPDTSEQYSSPLTESQSQKEEKKPYILEICTWLFLVLLIVFGFLDSYFNKAQSNITYWDIHNWIDVKSDLSKIVNDWINIPTAFLPKSFESKIIQDKDKLNELQNKLLWALNNDPHASNVWWTVDVEPLDEGIVDSNKKVKFSINYEWNKWTIPWMVNSIFNDTWLNNQYKISITPFHSKEKNQSKEFFNKLKARYDNDKNIIVAFQKKYWNHGNLTITNHIPTIFLFVGILVIIFMYFLLSHKNKTVLFFRWLTLLPVTIILSALWVILISLLLPYLSGWIIARGWIIEVLISWIAQSFLFISIWILLAPMYKKEVYYISNIIMSLYIWAWMIIANYVTKLYDLNFFLMGVLIWMIVVYDWYRKWKIIW